MELHQPFTILDDFVGCIGNGGEAVQYYQHIHGKRLLNGGMARVPSYVFQFYRSRPSLVFLSGEAVDTSPSDLDHDFEDVLQWSDARYVLVHQSLLNDDQKTRFIFFLDEQPRLRRTGTDNDLIVTVSRPFALVGNCESSLNFFPRNPFSSLGENGMYCTHCAKELNEEARFCSACGKSTEKFGQTFGSAASRPVLRRAREGKKIAGVCAGIARYFDIDVTLIRILWILLSICPPVPGIVAYIICWIVIPQEPISSQTPSSPAPASSIAGA